MTSIIQKWGNSQGIRIPKFLLEALQWNENEEIVITAENDKLIIEKAHTKKNIMELFEEYEEEYEPEEIDWGKPAGDEIW